MTNYEKFNIAIAQSDSVTKCVETMWSMFFHSLDQADRLTTFHFQHTWNRPEKWKDAVWETQTNEKGERTTKV